MGLKLSKPSCTWHGVRRGLVAGSCLLLAVAILVTGFILYTQRGSNFHVVEPGQFYRTGRMPVSRLQQVVRQYNIRSVINLEGAKPANAWYRDETRALDQLGIRHIDFRLSAREIVPPPRLAELLDVLRTAPKPVLVHCRDGADRTGLVAALYLAKVAGRDEDTAYHQLSLSFGHFPYLGSETDRMDQTYWLAVDPDHHPG